MTEREAQEVIRMVESGWNVDFGYQGRTLWAQMLYRYEADLATMAVAKMSEEPLPANRSKPQVSDLKAVIQKFRADREVAAIPQVSAPIKERVPEWIWVWNWCRNQRTPRCLVSFPQQEADPTETITKAEYEKLRDEWLEAGSPKAEHPIPLAAIAGERHV